MIRYMTKEQYRRYATEIIDEETGMTQLDLDEWQDPYGYDQIVIVDSGKEEEEADEDDK